MPFLTAPNPTPNRPRKRPNAPTFMQMRSPRHSGQALPGHGKSAYLRALRVHRPARNSTDSRAVRRDSGPPARVQVPANPPPQHRLQPPGCGPQPALRRPKRGGLNPHRIRENPGFHDACTAHNGDRSRRHSPGFLPRQGPRQRPVNPLEGRGNRSRNGPRGRPADHRRHAHAPPGSRFEQGKSGPRAPRCGPRMAHQDSPFPRPKTVFGQPPGGGHRRGTRLRRRARVQRSLHVSPPGRCHNPRPKPVFHPVHRRHRHHPIPGNPRKNT